MRILKLNQSTIEKLSKNKHPIAGSLYMPMHGSAEPQAISEDTSRLNSMIHRLKQKIDNDQRYVLRHRFDELHELVGSVDYWKNRQGKAVAFFVSPHELISVDLPIETEESVFIDSNYVVGPMIAQLFDDMQFYVLDLDKNQPQLFRGNRFGLESVEVETMPKSYVDALNIDELLQRQQQFHTGGRGGSAMFHGHGAAKDNSDTDMKRYLSIVRDAITPVIKREPLPIVLAGNQKMASMYREVHQSDMLLGEVLDYSLRDGDLTEFHSKVWPIIERHAQQAKNAHMEELAQMSASEPTRVSTDLKAIKEAAMAGKIHKLFVAMAVKTKDSVRDGISNSWLEKLQTGEIGKDINAALLAAWKHRGEIVFINKLPQDQMMSAILRY